MRILLVNRFCGGAQVPTGRMLGDVADELAAAGHEVTVLTSTGRYSGAGVSGATARRDAVNMVQVHIPGWLPRLGAWICFSWLARRKIPAMSWEVCVLMTDPPLLPWLATSLRRARPNGRLVVWLMDLYPEALAASGRLARAGWTYRALLARRQAALRAADLLICLGERQKDLLGPEVTAEVATAVVPPWDGRDDIRPSADADLQRMALYAGNLGEAHGFREILAALPHLPNDWTVRFAVRGAKAEALAEAAPRAARGNAGAKLEITGYVSEEQTPRLLAAARVHLITMSPDWSGVVVPSKLYGCVRTGRQVLFIGPEDSDTAEEIRSNAWGAVLPPGACGESVAQAILELAARPTSGASGNTGAARVAELVVGMGQRDRGTTDDRTTG